MNTHRTHAFSEADVLKGFQNDESLVVLVTYTGIIEVVIQEVTQYDLLIGDKEQLPKLAVVMAYSANDQQRIKDDLLVDEQVKALNQVPIKDIRYRRYANMVVAVGDPVRIVLRTGDVITGFCRGQTRYNILLNVNGALVLVYKHGIHELKNFK